MKFFYSKLVSRNWLFVEPALQKKMSRAHLVFAGCGLGSNIAILAARHGFTNFSLWDGDKVELSNLNRQAYFLEDIGKNKAQQLSKHILRINPNASVRVHNCYIDDSNVSTVIKKGDILFNTVNFDHTFFKLLKSANRRKAVSLLPLNIGYGSIVVVFRGMSSLLRKASRDIKNDVQMYNFLLTNLKRISINRRLFNQTIFTKIKKVGYDPQLGLAASASASLSLSCIIKILQKKKLLAFPRAYQVEL